MKKAILIILASCFLWGMPWSSEAITLGPYSGRVQDSATGQPINGASVFFYWTKTIPHVGGGNSETLGSRLIDTDESGRYHLPEASYNMGLLAFFEATHIIIYQPGYRAYIRRIDNNNPYQKPDPSLKDVGNIVKLDPIGPDFSHKKHCDEIDAALWGIDSFSYPDPALGEPKVSWPTFVNRNLKSGIIEKAEFLRRVEWEQWHASREDGR